MRRAVRDRAVGLLEAASRRLPARPVAADARRGQVFPVRETGERRLKADLLLSGRVTFFCPVCGRRSLLTWGRAALRETVLCFACGSYNRQRQVAAVVLAGHPGCSSLQSLPAGPRVLNTESGGALHAALCHLPGYVCSEYFGDGHASGDLVDGRLHQDLMATSFPDGSFDLVVSSDVFEHIPHPYAAHAEVFRILAPGGRHVMTAPFRPAGWRDEVRATLEPDGTLRHHLEPEYHGDRLRPDDGILAFRRFGMESLVRCAEIGFEPRFHRLRIPRLGIIGREAYVFELVKPP
jgi:SAM-dependent methyltransferase